ncbi:TonB-dependent receptor [Caulobacter sp. 1776]|uniref:TonB-dependent receptor plug domain-containing protein n=1 Tax=Caulobacter sp. 1776 TaxID=3156420 RepID=UPI003394B5CB
MQGCGGRLAMASVAAVLIQAAAAGLGHAQNMSQGDAHPEKPPRDLADLSIEALGDIQVTSVSKRAETVMDAPAAVYLISREDALRSGADSLPELLRLAPNLQVAQRTAGAYAITARGLNGDPEAQNFSNKLLVLIDGRTVYSPLFSGVYWEMQDVLPADLDRIEVVSGPGATLWGANAVNGVINITSRSADETQGLYLQGRGGAQGRSASIRYGGLLGQNGAFRVYARSARLDATETATGASAEDDFHRAQGGFRADWDLGGGEALTLSGDLFDGAAKTAGVQEDLSGRNLTARWRREVEGSTLQAQAYYDHNRRATSGSGAFGLDTYDFDLQHAFARGRHQFVWGGGARISRYDIRNTPDFVFTPSNRTLRLYNLFLQDRLALTDNASLTLGLKLEDGPYDSAQWSPSVRFAWRASEDVSIWAAASRALRVATPFDRDVLERLGGRDFLVGGGDFQPEKLTAYEVGARFKPGAKALLSISAYYNVYDDLRSIETTPATFLPLRWGNGLQGHVRGIEAWGEYKVRPWWRLSAGATAMEKHLKFKPGSSGILGVAQAGDDPRRQAFLRSSVDLPRGISLDADLRYVSDLPEPRTPSYVELGGRLAWAVNDRAEVALVGRNLMHDRHPEYPQGTDIPRAVSVDLQWRF